MHVTTRIEGRENDSLLSDKGFRGFPSLAFMDAEGNVVAKPQGRTVAAFQATLTAITDFAEITKRIEAGETGLETDLLLAEYALGKVQGAQFKTRAEGLEKVTPEQQAKIDQILVDTEISRLSSLPRRGPGGLEEAGKGLLKMLEDGKRPSKEVKYAANFWITLGNYATSEFNADLCRKASKGLAEDLPNEAFTKTYIKNFDEMAGKIDEHTALVKRSEGGEAGLEVDLLLAEYGIGATKGGAFKEKATPLLEQASGEQKTKLEAVLREIAFGDILANARGPAGLDTAGPALLELLKDGRQPPEAVAGRAWGLLSQYARKILDPDLMDRAADGIMEAYADNKGALKYAADMKEQAKKLREEKAKAEAAPDKANDAGKEDGDG